MTAEEQANVELLENAAKRAAEETRVALVRAERAEARVRELLTKSRARRAQADSARSMLEEHGAGSHDKPGVTCACHLCEARLAITTLLGPDPE